MPGGNGPYFRVIYAGTARSALQRLAEKAKQLQLGPQFVLAVKTIDRRLRSDPLMFGEPLYNLKSANLQVRICNEKFLFVRFAVDKQRRLIYVADCIGSPSLGF